MSVDLHLTAHVDISGAEEGLARIGRHIDRDATSVIAAYARRRILPATKRLAPRIIADTLIVREEITKVAVTTNATGIRRRIVGITNEGGTIRTPIVPKKAKALHLAGGGFAAKVTKPRKIPGSHYIDQAVDDALPDTARELERELPRIMQRRLDGIMV